jgi:hypothetical protein
MSGTPAAAACLAAPKASRRGWHGWARHQHTASKSRSGAAELGERQLSLATADCYHDLQGVMVHGVECTHHCPPPPMQKMLRTHALASPTTRTVTSITNAQYRSVCTAPVQPSRHPGVALVRDANEPHLLSTVAAVCGCGRPRVALAAVAEGQASLHSSSIGGGQQHAHCVALLLWVHSGRSRHVLPSKEPDSRPRGSITPCSLQRHAACHHRTST